ncbi:MAG: bifunctional enoyl-CoA hydratase/phosphate acetyltransferase [Casimicrobium sp.]
MGNEVAAVSAAHPRLTALITSAREAQPTATAIVYPKDAMVVEAALVAARLGIIEPVFYGPAAARDFLGAAGAWPAQYRWVDTGDSPRAAALMAIADAASGRVAMLMKGSLHTDELLGAVVARDSGLRGTGRLTHTFVFDLPRYHKLLAVTDAVVNISPDLQTKAESLIHAIALMQKIGVATPKIAVLAAVETVNASIPATVDARTLTEWGVEGRFGAALVDGPLGFDNAISVHAAETKGIVSAVAGDPDILLAPDLNCGNILYKSFVYIGGGECAGVVQGSRVPIVITSRADSLFSRVASCALARISLR